MLVVHLKREKNLPFIKTVVYAQKRAREIFIVIQLFNFTNYGHPTTKSISTSKASFHSTTAAVSFYQTRVPVKRCTSHKLFENSIEHLMGCSRRRHLLTSSEKQHPEYVIITPPIKVTNFHRISHLHTRTALILLSRSKVLFSSNLQLAATFSPNSDG